MEKQNGVHCPTKLVGPTRQILQQQAQDFQISVQDNNNEQATNGSSNGLERHSQIQQIVESAVREDARPLIGNILEQVASLTWTEKLLLYLKLPTESANSVDPLRQPLNPLGSRSEISQTIMWIKTHLEEDPELSLPKQDVYEEYLSFGSCNKMKPLSTADFGKVMKQVYPRVRPRRLGTRGNSRYCYAGLRKRLKLEAPVLPDISTVAAGPGGANGDVAAAAWFVIKEWAEALLGVQFGSLHSLAAHLVDKMSVNTGTVAACLVASVAATNNNHPHLTSGERNNNNSKHREMQVQLQRKLQQKEAKRKLQVGGGGGGAGVAASGGCKRAKNSNQVCDKTADLLTTLPERNKPQLASTTTTGTAVDENNEQIINNVDSASEFVFCDNSSLINATTTTTINNNTTTGKVQAPQVQGGAKLPIPRLVPTKTASLPSATGTLKKQKSFKYKTIQPKPAKCDIVRSQMKRQQQQVQQQTGYGMVEKDCLDDYLIGGSNSQEQEEELLQYFSSASDNGPALQASQSAASTPSASTGASSQHTDHKLSQLRLLLQQNCKTAIGSRKFASSNLQARRRVSFETQDQQNASILGQQSSSVPPSPNTRRKNFSFTPISPGPQSPNTISPFVSPRNTPVPKNMRCRLHTVESAPPSPMGHHHHHHQQQIQGQKVAGCGIGQIKNSQSSYAAFPNYAAAGDFFTEPTVAAFRSQSVPLSQQFTIDPGAPEFADFDASLNDTGLNTENFNKILNILDNSQSTQQQLDVVNATSVEESEMLSNAFDLQQNVFQFDGFGQQNSVSVSADDSVFSDTLLPNLSRNLCRSQSTDTPMKYNVQPPSRSVPSTPLPSLNLNYINNNIEITSRSYPSTPTDTLLGRYHGAGLAHLQQHQQQSAASTTTQDFLLNGQPVKELFGGEMIFSTTGSSPQQDNNNKMVNDGCSSSAPSSIPPNNSSVTSSNNPTNSQATCNNSIATSSPYQNCNYGYSDYVPSNGHSNV